MVHLRPHRSDMGAKKRGPNPTATNKDVLPSKPVVSVAPMSAIDGMPLTQRTWTVSMETPSMTLVSILCRTDLLETRAIK